MCDANPLNLDWFLEKLYDWGMTVTEDMDPAGAGKYVFTRFQWRLPQVLQELYLVAAKDGKIMTHKEAKKWLNGAGGRSPSRCQEVESHQLSA